MAVTPQNIKYNLLLNMSDYLAPSLLSSPSFQTKQSQEVQNVQRMIQMLKNYESNCLQKGNFFQAEASKLRIDQLKQQQLKAEHEELKQKNKENVEEIERRNGHEMDMFHDEWEVKVKEHLEEYKLLQERLKEDHKRELEELQVRMTQEEPGKIKYSTTVLKKRNHLQNLIKCRMYIEAEFISQELQRLQQRENQQWIHKFQEKKKKQFDQVIKRHEVETKALKIKIKSMFNEKMKEKEEAFGKLLNKIQKRKVQARKCPVEVREKEREIRKGAESRASSKQRTVLGESRRGV